MAKVSNTPATKSIPAMLTIQLFGQPQIWVDQDELTIPRRKSRAVVYYLAAQTTPITREHIMALLWPDHERTTAQQILRTTLHAIRKILGDLLVTTDTTLTLHPHTMVDVRSLEIGLTAPTADIYTLAKATTHYRGDFLDGFVLPDSPAFEEWVNNERERYRQMVINGSIRLATQYEEQQQPGEALATLQQIITMDPFQERVQCDVIRLHYLMGNRASAIRQYEKLRDLLDNAMGVPPMAETQALYDTIVTDTFEQPSTPKAATHEKEHTTTLKPTRSSDTLTQDVPFVGRTRELQSIRAALGAHQFILIEGEPGIGKTRLATEVIHTNNALPLIGAARELEHTLPYQPIIESLRSLLTHPEWPLCHQSLDMPLVWQQEIARLLPELAISTTTLLVGASHDTFPHASRGRSEESRLWEGVSQFLSAVARHRPLILFIDDLHWADAATLALLGYVTRQTHTIPLDIIATARPVRPHEPFTTLRSALLREHKLLCVTLDRLSIPDITSLAHNLSPDNSVTLADWLLQTSEGNPYILSELIRDARLNNALLPDGTLNLSALSEVYIVPQTIYALIQSRLTRLSPAARTLLDVAVAAGRDFDFDVVAQASSLDESLALDALDELRAVSMIRPLDQSRYSFDHSLTSEVARQEMGEPRYRQLHRRIADGMIQLYQSQIDEVAGLIATHFAQANALECATLFAVQAGQRAMRLTAWQEAISFYRQALVGADQEEWFAITMELGEAYFHAGEALEASEIFQSALTWAETHEDQVKADDARLALARSLIPQSRFAEIITLINNIQTTDVPDHKLTVEFLWGTALSLEGFDLAAATEHLKAAEALHEQQGQANPSHLVQIRFELGSVAAQQGDLTTAIAYYHAALATAEESNDALATYWRTLVYNNLAYHLLLLGDATAIEYAQTGMQHTQEHGLLGLQPYLHSTLGEIAMADNDLSTAKEQFTMGLQLAERLSMPERVAGLTANLGLVALHQNQRDQATQYLSTALKQADMLQIHHLAAQIRVWMAPLLPLDAAHEYLDTARTFAEQSGRQRLLAEIQHVTQQLSQTRS
ncbi:MAG: Tetratricopeptide (TPR) repeat [Chloroflexi bacterium AL-W]|nr:Tetratricopeptide (TPR) repeat [Chloroflexi bacterium AL-N1]NOK70441.1 Tetratricopeptide (TPR) repeat [Chloroflexi bacterium AL-N10]NOK78200.1 Tetratricopeptide (TPR) repeat [Chloroflexi bacterium AL-N5]NOK85299.1 Tetratricopeptide (TPR) repeat [Chloroflexi bacterium AL-W]NOK92064.1 Tetratricopeptide (TPR) repeat [Chloroflexi bacterium AL-N15]